MALLIDNGKVEESHKLPKERYFGHFTNNKWYCDCNLPAHFRPVVKRNSNHNRKFWICPKLPKECEFFLWLDDEEVAKKWLQEHGAPPSETPRRGGKSNELSTPGASEKKAKRSLETPFTMMAKRKEVSREDSKEKMNSSLNGSLHGDETTESSGYSDDSSPEKPAKRIRFSTPPTINNKPMALGEAFLTPVSGPRPNGDDVSYDRDLRRSIASSPTPANRRNRNLELGKSHDRAATILSILRSDSIIVKGTTETKIRHEIGLLVDSFEARERRFEKTILELSNRVDSLENTLDHLTGGIAANDIVELSD